MSTTFIIILTLTLIILIISAFIFFSVTKTIRDFSKQVFNTANIIEGFKKQEIEYEETPKSLSSLDSVLIPKILNDFPHLNIDSMKQIAQNGIRDYYDSLNSRTLKESSYNNANLNSMLLSKIENLKNQDTKYNKLHIHKTVINSYNNQKGSCIITFQSAIEYTLHENNKDKKIQERINVDMIYIYDDTHIKGASGVSLNCENCGAPIKMLGIKTCPYCETGIIDYIPRVWKINNIYTK